MKERVLIAEDSPSQREALHFTLENAGYRVRVARDGDEAMKLALEEKPDLVVTDIMMPVCDGYELCRRLKARPGLQDVPVILLTGLADPGDIIAGLQCGADGFIGKPFTEEDLLLRLREVLINRSLPDRETPTGGVRVHSGGQLYTIDASRTQILDLLLSVYQAALRRNRDLIEAERELLELNRELERKFKERGQLLERERAAREEAERATRMKEEFLATVSHELRTPLSAISGWVQFLRQGQPAAQELEEALGVIERNAWAQTQLIDDLLDMSRIVSGKIRLEVAEVDLAQVIQAGVETVRTAAEARRVRLEVRLQTPARIVRGDRARLQQVIWNLLSNAVKFTPADGVVTVILQGSENGMQIEVRDTGTGIERDFLPFVFDRFSQSDASMRRKHGGLGLGLAIVKHLVELHGGTVGVSSEGQGRGATFTVWLPVRASFESPAVRAEERIRRTVDDRAGLPGEVRLDALRVLVVEDDDDVRLLLERVLQERGADVTSASSAQAAMEAFATGRFDVLVSDIGMPDEDGYKLIRQVRQSTEAATVRVPALAFTAFARAQDRADALNAGFDAYLSKPVDTQKLICQIHSLAAGQNAIARSDPTKR